MNDDRDIKIYIASNNDVLNTQVRQESTLLFEGQKHKYTLGSDISDFNPLLFLASNACELFSNCKIEYAQKSKIPSKCSYILDGICYDISRDNLDTRCKDMLTSLYINSCLKGKIFCRDGFDVAMYYSQHFEKIDLHSTLSDKVEATLKFYIEYGYWADIKLEHVNPYQIIASYPDFLKAETADRIDVILPLYFKDTSLLLLFKPTTYIASNWEVMKEFVSKKGCFQTTRICKHYINKGASLGYNIGSFDHWKYLANNPKRIKEMLGNEMVLSKLTQSNVAEIFIKHRGKSKMLFSATDFIRMYIDDIEVNYDNKLTISNAEEYFVRGYVNSETVRWKMSYTHKSLFFIRNRILDGVRQVPFHAVRICICGKLL
jgi:hypothetical protein